MMRRPASLRSAVREAMAAVGRPMTPAAIVEATGDRLSQAGYYAMPRDRILAAIAALVEAGELVPALVGEGMEGYRLAQGGRSP